MIGEFTDILMLSFTYALMTAYMFTIALNLCSSTIMSPGCSRPPPLFLLVLPPLTIVVSVFLLVLSPLTIAISVAGLLAPAPLFLLVLSPLITVVSVFPLVLSLVTIVVSVFLLVHCCG